MIDLYECSRRLLAGGTTTDNKLDEIMRQISAIASDWGQIKDILTIELINWLNNGEIYAYSIFCHPDEICIRYSGIWGKGQVFRFPIKMTNMFPKRFGPFKMEFEWTPEDKAYFDQLVDDKIELHNIFDEEENAPRIKERERLARLGFEQNQRLIAEDIARLKSINIEECEKFEKELYEFFEILCP